MSKAEDNHSSSRKTAGESLAGLSSLLELFSIEIADDCRLFRRERRGARGGGTRLVDALDPRSLALGELGHHGIERLNHVADLSRAARDGGGGTSRVGRGKGDLLSRLDSGIGVLAISSAIVFSQPVEDPIAIEPVKAVEPFVPSGSIRERFQMLERVVERVHTGVDT
jgi:hypothetical protein